MKELHKLLAKYNVKELRNLSEDQLVQMEFEINKIIDNLQNDIFIKNHHLEMSFKEVQSWILLIDQQSTLMQSIFNATSDMIIALDSDLNIIEMNIVAETILGKKYIEIKGSNFFTLFPGNQWIKDFLHETDFKQEQISVRKITELVINNEKSIMCDFLITKIKSGAVDISTFCIKDLTEQLDSQKQLDKLRATAAEAGKLSSLGEMASGIAHEINNPLAIISNTTSYLRKEFQKGKLTQEDFNDSIDDIELTIERISKIVKGLRNISRDSTNEKMSGCQLRDVVTDVLSVCQERFKNHEVVLEVNDPESVTEMSILCYRVQLSQVMLNLISNAFDAVEKLSEKWVKLEFKATDKNVVINIMDSGHGIPLDITEKIFQPFYTTKEIGKGTGLGLSLSKSLIEKQGGSLSINKECMNTCFEIKIPLKIK